MRNKLVILVTMDVTVTCLGMHDDKPVPNDRCCIEVPANQKCFPLGSCITVLLVFANVAKYFAASFFIPSRIAAFMRNNLYW